MSETANRLEDVEKQISAEDATLEEARRRRRETLGISERVGGVLGSFASGSVAMGVVNDPVEDADGGIILDRREYPSLGPDGEGDTPGDIVAELHALVGPAIREIWPKATVHDMKRGITVRMHAPLLSGADPYVDVVVAMNRKDAPGLWIPNLVANCWDASHPPCHVELMLAGTRALRRTRARVVRLGKAWNKPYADPALSSFNIVALALECITASMPIDKALLVFFEHAATATSIPPGCRLPTGRRRASPGPQGRGNQPQRDGEAVARRAPRGGPHHQGHARLAAPAILYGRRRRGCRPGSRSAHRQLRAHDPPPGVQGCGALGSARSQPGRRRRPAPGRPEG